MVWGVISKKGKLPLLFIDKGVKVNQEYYLNNVLIHHLLPFAKKLYGDQPFCFQQDSAPAHKAKTVQSWCRDNLPYFISTDEWPASSPDLNPLDYSIWGYMMARLSNLKCTNLAHFKVILNKIWDEIPDNIVRAACSCFNLRLKAVVKAKGERIEM